VSKDTLDIKELLNKVGWIAFLAGKTSPDDENKDNYYKQSEISIKRAEQALNLYIEERVADAEKKNLDALYWMYDQYCSGSHDFMGAGEDASEILENAGYIEIDGAGRITKDIRGLKEDI